MNPIEIIVKLAAGTKQSIQNSLNAMSGLHANVNIKLNQADAKKNIKTSLNALGNVDVKVNGKLNKTATLKSIKQDMKTLTNIKVNVKGTLDKQATRKQLKAEMQDVAADIKLPPSTSKAAQRIASASAKAPQIESSFLGGIKDKLNVVFGIDGLVRRFGRLVGDTVRKLKAIDTQMTEISKTANLTKREMMELGETSFDSANKFGRGVDAYLKSANSFAQAGKKNVAELSELSLMAQSAGNMDATLSDEYLLATDAAYGFGGSVKALTQVLDGQNQVTNRNAVDMSNIAEAVKITGSQAAQSGVGIDQMTAAISTMSTVTQLSGSEVGRAFKGILMNLQKVKGEVVDGEIIDAESLSKSEKALSSVGINLKEVKNGVLMLRDPMEVIKELSAAFMALDERDARRANIVESIGGKYRGNQLTALLSNYEMYEKILNDYADSEGSAMEESQKTADSWEGKINQLSNSWTQFIAGFVKTDWVKGSIGGLNNMVQSLDELNRAGMFIPTLVGSVTALQTVLHKDYGITQIINQNTGKADVKGNLFGVDFTAISKQKTHFADAEKAIEKWNRQVKSGTADINQFGGAVTQNNAEFENYLATTQNGNASLSGYKASLNAAGISTDALRLKTIALNAIIGLGIGLAIQGIIVGVQALADAYVTLAEQEDKVAQTSENYQKVKSDISDINDELTTTGEKIDALHAKGALSLTEKDELSNLNDTNDALTIRLALLEKEAEIAAKNLGDESVKLFDRQFGDFDFSHKKVDEYQNNAKANGNNVALTADENNVPALIAAYKQFSELKNKAENPEDAQHYLDIASGIEEKLLASATALQTTRDNLMAIQAPSAEQLVIIDKAKTGLDLINESIMPEKWKAIKFEKIYNDAEMKSTKKQLDALAKTAPISEATLNNPQYDIFKQKLADVGITAEEAAAQINGLTVIAISPDSMSTYDVLQSTLTNVSAAQDAFTAALEEQDAQGVVSAETLGKLIALDEDYIDCLEDSSGMLKLNADKFRELNQAKLEVAKTTAQEALSNTIWSAALSGNDAVDDEITKLAMLCNSYEYATSGYKAWLDAKSAPDVGSVFNQGKDALKALQDGLNSGEVGTNVFKGAQQFLIPQEVIDKGLQSVQNYIYDMQGYFKDGFAGVEYGWQQLQKAGLADLKDGTWTIKPDVDDEDIRRELDITSGLLQAWTDDAKKYGAEFNFDDESVLTLSKEIQGLVAAKQELGTAISIGDDGQIDAAKQRIQGFIDKLHELPEETLAKVGITVDDKDNLLDANGKIIKVDADIAGAEASLEAIGGKKEETAQNTEFKIDANTAQAQSNVTNLHNAIIALPKTTEIGIHETTYKNEVVNSTQFYDKATQKKSNKNGKQAAANGITGAKADGRSLVGEEAPEIHVSRKNGIWNLVGEHGAEFVDVEKGDIIFNGEQTKRLLANGFVDGRGDSYLNGTGGNAYRSGSMQVPIHKNPSSSNKNNKTNTASQKALAKAQKAAADAHKKALEAQKKILEDQKKVLDEQNDALKKQKEKYDSVLSAVDDLLSKEIDGIKKSNDAPDKTADKIKKDLDGIQSAIDYVLGKEIDALEDAKDALSDPKIEGSYQNRIDSIQDIIDATNKETEAQDHLLAVEKAKAAYENAQTQKTQRVFTKGKGYVWATNESALLEAKDNLDKAEKDNYLYTLGVKKDELENQMKTEQEKIQDQIDALSKYKDSFKDFVDEYKIQTDLEIAASILGADWQKRILTDRQSIFSAFTADYLDKNNQLNDTTKEIEANDARITKLEEMKTAWSDADKAYQKHIDDKNALELLGQGWEADILSGRTKTLNDFKTNYFNVMDAIAGKVGEIEALEKRIAQASANISAAGNTASNTTAPAPTPAPAPAPDSGNNGTLPPAKNPPDKTPPRITEAQWLANNPKPNAPPRGSGSYQVYLDSPEYKQYKGLLYAWERSKHFAGFAKGTLNAPSGMAFVDDEEGIKDPRELIIPKSRGRLRNMEYGDMVIPANLSQIIMNEALNNPIMPSMREMTMPNMQMPSVTNHNYGQSFGGYQY